MIYPTINMPPNHIPTLARVACILHAMQLIETQVRV